ncbi:MAG TPA: hypothetical protein VGC42_06940, partial [Kofleriaceae bacterium]
IASPTGVRQAPVEGSPRAAVGQDSDALTALKAHISNVTDDLKSRGTSLADRATSLVATRPWTALAVAAGAGYVAMRVVTSRLTPIAILGGLFYVAGGALRK